MHFHRGFHFLIFLGAILSSFTAHSGVWKFAFRQAEGNNQTFIRTLEDLSSEIHYEDLLKMYCDYNYPSGWTSGSSCWYYFPLNNLATTCTINGSPYSQDVVIDSIRWSIKANNRDIDSGLHSANNTGIPLVISGIHDNITNLPETVTINCTTTKDSSVLVLSPDLVETGESVITTTLNFNLIRSSSIAISQQPAHITGSVGLPVDAPFNLQINDVWNRSYKLSWDVGAPCSQWQPVLKLPSNTLLTPGADVEGDFDHGIHILTARFTPTNTGHFTCTGTVTVTQE
jgi:hypothetical protein